MTSIYQFAETQSNKTSILFRVPIDFISQTEVSR